ncbi:MAG: 50S ribosomal protein L15 [Thermoprotei archaeon]|nr:MAG: 50S ribosomal protein L15 [Thermoprotei archaeon]
MSVRRKKKSRSYRGTRSCGWGRVGQHRRRGRKAGRGRAGYHKHKWTWVVKYAPDWFGKRGFTRHPSITPKYKTINIGEIEEMVEEWLSKGLATRTSEDLIEIDLPKIGYSKVLGRGELTRPVVIKALKFTENAKKKIESVGGKVVEVR